MKLYISGPMRGYPRFNFDAFDACETFLWQHGDMPVSPAAHDRHVYPDIEDWPGFASGDTSLCPKFDLHRALSWDLAQVAQCDGIVLLPGWENSTGAKHERYVADVCGKLIYTFDLVLDGAQRNSELLDVARRWRFTLKREAKPPTTLLIGCTGPARVGKDLVGKMLNRDQGCEVLKFAARLYGMLLATNPLVPVQVKHVGLGVYTDYQRLSRVVSDIGWEKAKDEIPEVRALLQRLGTEGGREHLGTDVWVDAAMGDVTPGGKFVFTDCRFPNEARAILDAGGEVWRIERPGYGPVNEHVSDSGLPDELVTRTIVNDGTHQELRRRVNALFTPQ